MSSPRRAQAKAAMEIRPCPPPRTRAVAVEVTSNSTALRDGKVKKVEYEEFGIAPYWIVSPEPQAPSLTAYGLCDGRYERVAHVEDDETFHVELPFRVDITPARPVTSGQWK